MFPYPFSLLGACHVIVSYGHFISVWKEDAVFRISNYLYPRCSVSFEIGFNVSLMMNQI